MNPELSRIGGLVDDDGTTPLADYLYLGRNRTVEVGMPEPGVKFTWLWQTGDPSSADPYTGWDRFGRAVDLRWIKTSNGAERERIKHGYDEASNRLYRKNPVAAGYSAEEDQLYDYDRLYQLQDFQRGTLNGGNNGISPLAARERFTFDPTGNWNSYQVNNDTPQTRLHNEANELTEIDSSDEHVAEDLAGNMTKVPQPGDWGHHYDLTYDAWNRLVKVEDGETVVAEYAYDGLNRRIKKKIGGDTRHYYYSDRWQILEERVDESEAPDRQFVWGLRYIDDLVLRDREMGEEDERLYVIQDYFQPTAVISRTDGEVLERYGYDAFGTSRVMDDEFEVKTGGSDYEWETRYGAYRWDGETGLYQVRHRYLHPGLGRWASRDPIEYEDGVNLYAYVANNSVNRIDYLGLDDRGGTMGEGGVSNHSTNEVWILDADNQQVYLLPPGGTSPAGVDWDFVLVDGEWQKVGIGDLDIDDDGVKWCQWGFGFFGVAGGHRPANSRENQGINAIWENGPALYVPPGKPNPKPPSRPYMQLIP